MAIVTSNTPSSLKAEYITTAANAAINFAGHEIGELQNFNITENSDTVRLNAIGNMSTSKLVPGFFEVQIEAERALVDGDIFFDLCGVVDTAYLNTGGRFNQDVSIPSLAVLRNAFLNTTLQYGVKGAAVFFDIVLKNAAGYVMWRYDQCTFVSKRITMATGGIIIMSNVTLYARKKQFGDAQEVQMASIA